MTTPPPPPDVPAKRAEQPPEPGSAWVRDHEPPASEAEREAQATVRSVSRLEEAN